jgi:hypothetical protein
MELELTETRKKYRGTVGAFRNLDTGEIHPAYFADFSQQGDNPVVVGSWIEKTAKGIKEANFSVPYHRIEILPMPDRQVYDNNGVTNIYERYPSRQWQKGLSHNNTKITRIVKNIISENLPSSKSYFSNLDSQMGGNDFGLKNIYQLLINDRAGSFEEAIKDIMDNNKISRSFSKSLFVMITPSLDPTFLLFRFEIPLAKYDLKTNTFKVLNTVYYQEVVDLVNRQQLNSRVEV